MDKYRKSYCTVYPLFALYKLFMHSSLTNQNLGNFVEYIIRCEKPQQPFFSSVLLSEAETSAGAFPHKLRRFAAITNDQKKHFVFVCSIM